MYSLGSIIGTAIGCFMLALIVGFGMGLLSGVSYNKRMKVFKLAITLCKFQICSGLLLLPSGQPQTLHVYYTN